MNNLVFICIILAIVIFGIISSNARSKQKNEALKSHFIESFGQRNKVQKGIRLQHDVIGEYFKTQANQTDNGFIIDDITWNDLNLDAVFGQINTTLTSVGEEYLYSSMRLINDQAASKQLYDTSIDLAVDEEQRVGIQMSLHKLGKLHSASAFGIITRLFESKANSITRDIVFDILLLLSLLFVFVSPGIGALLFIAFLIVNITTYFSGKAKMETDLRAFNYVCNMIKCKKSIDEILNSDGDKQLYDLLKGTVLLPRGASTSSNPVSIILDYIRMIFHVDIILFNRKLSKLVDNKTSIISMYEQIGYIDVCIAIASYVDSYEDVCVARFVEGKSMIDAEALYHPLVGTPVKNDISSKGGVLITGSNASGKSTFLKAVGINVIFAQSFGFALADTFTLTPLRLYTSMAISDNILGDESYYVVESKSLKRICDAAKEHDNVLAIVDEVLKGTNTAERIAASYEILLSIIKQGIIMFVATHDIELTSLLKDSYDLYYFTEKVENGNVIFPYKIYEGVSDSGNAIRLLDVLGYDREIVEGANQMASQYKETGKWDII